MASTPANEPAQQLPLFYASLTPLSSQLHPGHGLTVRDNLNYTRITHAIPITVDEFAVAQRHYPIVFGLGENPAPLARIGLKEGDNLFVGDDCRGPSMWRGREPDHPERARKTATGCYQGMARRPRLQAVACSGWHTIQPNAAWNV